MIICTRRQAQHWRDTYALYGHTLSVTRDNRIIHKLFGDFLRKEGRLEDAVGQYEKALEISPAFRQARESMAMTLLDMNEPTKTTAALSQFSDMDSIRPEVHVRLAVSYVQKRKLAAAEKHFKAALRARSDWPEVHNALGKVYSMQKKYDLAIGCYREALRLKPNYREAAGNLAKVERLKQAQPD